ncbi:MAG TPA: hypothetical protein VEC18_10105 [Myxococcota bacterium]|nr:hypothetical protein [Myxococcota bacterium]
MAIAFDPSRRAVAAALALLALGACAQTQTYRLDCVPKDVTIYLDKVPLERVPDELALRVDSPHVLYFKGEGYEPTMVVLEIEETAEGPALSPSDLCLDLRLSRRDRDLEVEVEE